MNLQQLSHVVEVAKYSSINKAAKNLYISQSTLSKSISSLEKELGITIFTRSRNGIIPTSSGIEFIQQARAVLSQFNQISLFYEERNSPKNIVRVTSGRHTFVTEAIVNFCNLYVKDLSNVKIIVNEKPPQKIYKDILDGTSDIGMVCLCKNNINFWKEFFEYYSIHMELLFNCEERLILRGDHPLFSEGNFGFEELKKFPVVQSFEPNTDFPNFDTEIELLRYREFPKVIRTGERSVIYGLLQMTNCIFFATTDLCVADFFPGLVSLPMPDALSSIEWGHYVIYSEKRALTKIEKDFIGFMQQVCRP